jgi:hypothetical protein
MYPDFYFDMCVTSYPYIVLYSFKEGSPVTGTSVFICNLLKNYHKIYIPVEGFNYAEIQGSKLITNGCMCFMVYDLDTMQVMQRVNSYVYYPVFACTSATNMIYFDLDGNYVEKNIQTNKLVRKKEHLLKHQQVSALEVSNHHVVYTLHSPAFVDARYCICNKVGNFKYDTEASVFLDRNKFVLKNNLLIHLMSYWDERGAVAIFDIRKCDYVHFIHGTFRGLCIY